MHPTKELSEIRNYSQPLRQPEKNCIVTSTARIQPYLRNQIAALAVKVVVDVFDQVQALPPDIIVVLQGRHLLREKKKKSLPS
jgi:hypothetical protein